MSKLLVALSVVAAITGTVATRLIWTLLVDPATMATALASGSLTAVLSTIAGAH